MNNMYAELVKKVGEEINKAFDAEANSPITPEKARVLAIARATGFPSEKLLAHVYDSIISNAEENHQDDQDNPNCEFCAMSKAFTSSKTLMSEVFYKTMSKELLGGSTPAEAALVVAKLMFVLGMGVAKHSTHTCPSISEEDITGAGIETENQYSNAGTQGTVSGRTSRRIN